jgi:hypothetical protein
LLTHGFARCVFPPLSGNTRNTPPKNKMGVSRTPLPPSSSASPTHSRHHIGASESPHRPGASFARTASGPIFLALRLIGPCCRRPLPPSSPHISFLLKEHSAVARQQLLTNAPEPPTRTRGPYRREPSVRRRSPRRPRCRSRCGSPNGFTTSPRAQMTRIATVALGTARSGVREAHPTNHPPASHPSPRSCIVGVRDVPVTLLRVPIVTPILFSRSPP